MQLITVARTSNKKCFPLCAANVLWCQCRSEESSLEALGVDTGLKLQMHLLCNRSPSSNCFLEQPLKAELVTTACKSQVGWGLIPINLV